MFREEKDDDDDMKQENVVEDSNKATATATAVASTDNVVDEATTSTSLLHDSVTFNGDTQDIAKTPPAIPDIRKSRTSSSSELMSPMHDHTYALPPLLITPTMMATIDSHSLSHKGYTCLSKVGLISALPQLPEENSSLKKSVEFLKEAHSHLGT